MARKKATFKGRMRMAKSSTTGRQVGKRFRPKYQVEDTNRIVCRGEFI
jgi:hypothetical protein